MATIHHRYLTMYHICHIRLIILINRDDCTDNKDVQEIVC